MILQHKTKRVDAQYYMRVGREEEISVMLQEAKMFVANFDALVSDLTTDEIKDYAKKFRSLIK